MELEYSLAFRLLIYRVEIPGIDSRETSQRPVCIGKFHRDVNKEKPKSFELILFYVAFRLNQLYLIVNVIRLEFF